MKRIYEIRSTVANDIVIGYSAGKNRMKAMASFDEKHPELEGNFHASYELSEVDVANILARTNSLLEAVSST